MKNLNLTPESIDAIKNALLLIAMTLTVIFLFFNLIVYAAALLVVVACLTIFDLIRNKFKRKENK